MTGTVFPYVYSWICLFHSYWGHSWQSPIATDMLLLWHFWSLKTKIFFVDESLKNAEQSIRLLFFLAINIVIKWTAKNHWFNIFAILNFSCNIFTVFRIIVTRNPFVCYNTDILHYHWLSHFPAACQGVVVSHFSVR